MADADNDTQDENAEDGGGGKKKLIMLVVLGLVIAGLSVGGTLAALKLLTPPPPVEEGAEDAAAEEPTPPPAPAIYFPIKPELIVNFNVRGRQRYLQAELTLLVREEDVIAAIELHMSKIRNNLILLIGGEVYEELLTAEGKELLRQRCLQELQDVMQQEIGKPGIEQVLFTNFVMQ
ncbi:flagellar basal body-associated FliL family protein [Teredinibacter turnerae]|uniref:flagellar basal body-associated FliL family protein n=1 Tax=Teredinibacter turnerae TaxID=2426 RepID=UPI00036580E2|nr:flagellar basal body-associated FliL family protein [Teredinibacter turnerae]